MVYRKVRAMAGSVAFAFLTAALTFLLFPALISPANAVPSYARQTGQDPNTGDSVSVNQRNNSFVFCCATVGCICKSPSSLG